MIGRLRGELIVKQAPQLMLDVSGVGYDLIAPMTTFYRLPELGDTVVLFTHFAVSETSQQLYGFHSESDRDLFRLLIKVSGLGPKMGVSIMSMESRDIVDCVMQEKVAALVKVPGVGKKTAERLIIEMRDRIKRWQGLDDASSSHSAAVEQSPVMNTNHLIAEAESALVALGYRPAEAAQAVAKVHTDEQGSSEDLIRLALRAMLPA